MIVTTVPRCRKVLYKYIPFTPLRVYMMTADPASTIHGDSMSGWISDSPIELVRIFQHACTSHFPN